MKFISGMKNCHLPGLYSLVLSNRESEAVGMRRIFYTPIGGECPIRDLWQGEDFTLKPHNHRQTIDLTLLFGRALNWNLKPGHGSLDLHQYKFGSALLDGSFTLGPMWKEKFRIESREISSIPLHLHWSEIHTITAIPGSAWLVQERELAPEGVSRCLSTSDHLTLSNEGLYVPMTSEELLKMERIF